MGRGQHIILGITFFVSLSTFVSCLICQEGNFHQTLGSVPKITSHLKFLNDSFFLSNSINQLEPVICPEHYGCWRYEVTGVLNRMPTKGTGKKNSSLVVHTSSKLITG